MSIGAVLDETWTPSTRSFRRLLAIELRVFALVAVAIDAFRLRDEPSADVAAAQP